MLYPCWMSRLCLHHSALGSIPLVLFPPPVALTQQSGFPLMVPKVWYKEKCHTWVKEALHQNGYPERFILPQCSPSRKTGDDFRSHVIIPYIQCLSETVTRVLPEIDVQFHLTPFRTLRSILSSCMWVQLSHQGVEFWYQFRYLQAASIRTGVPYLM